MMRRSTPLVAILLFVALAGCVANPFQTASTAAERGFTGNVAELEAFALYGTFLIAEEGLARIIVKPGIPEAIKAKMKAADARAKTAADRMALAARGAAVERMKLKALEAIPETPPDRLAQARGAMLLLEAEVRTAMRVAQPEINSFVSVVRAFSKQPGG